MASIFDLIPSGQEKGVVFSIETSRSALNLTDEIEVKEYVRVDAAISQTHNSSVNPTLNPVEDGVDITDHVDIQSKTYSVDGVISDTPISLIETAIGSVAGIIGGAESKRTGSPITGALVTGGVAAFGGAILNNIRGNRVKTAFQLLQEAQDNKVLLTITSGLRTYNNMILNDLSVTKTATDGSTLPFTATLTEIKIVESETITISKKLIDESIAHSATGEGDLGNQDSNEAGFFEQIKEKSILKIGASAIGG